MGFGCGVIVWHNMLLALSNWFRLDLMFLGRRGLCGGRRWGCCALYLFACEWHAREEEGGPPHCVVVQYVGSRVLCECMWGYSLLLIVGRYVFGQDGVSTSCFMSLKYGGRGKGGDAALY